MLKYPTKEVPGEVEEDRALNNLVIRHALNELEHRNDDSGRRLGLLHALTEGLLESDLVDGRVNDLAMYLQNRN